MRQTSIIFAVLLGSYLLKEKHKGIRLAGAAIIFIGGFFISTACVFYAVLLNSSPEGLPASVFVEGKRRPEQEPAQSLLLQKVAWETVLNSEVGMRKSEKKD